MNKKVILILIVVLLVGCDNMSSNVVKEIDNNEDIDKIDVYFCPRDRCQDQLVQLIDSANESVHCALFDLDLVDVKKALDKKSYVADVRIVVDGDNYDKELAKKEYVRFDDKNQLSHNKFCVIDNKVISTGSFNPTYNCNFKNNNNLVIIKSKLLAANYESEFMELWHSEFGKGKNVKVPVIKTNLGEIENYFCPEDHCKDNAVRVLKTAKESIKFMTFSFTHDEIGDALLEKAANNVVVSGVFERTQNNEWCEYDRLKSAGLDVKWDENKANMHHKVFIVDDKIVVTGSFNPTSNGDESNDENILIIYNEDVAKKYVAEFDYVWNYLPTEETEEKAATDLVIKKVLYDPVGSDKGNEYVILYNIGDKNIDLSKYKLEDNKTSYKLSGAIKAQSEFKYDDSKLALRNSIGVLYLKTEYNEIIDYVAWEGFDDWELIDKVGEGLERTKFEMVNSEGEWG